MGLCGGGGPCDFSFSPSPFGRDFETLAKWKYKYSQEGITSVKSLGVDFSINNAFNPINLGAK